MDIIYKYLKESEALFANKAKELIDYLSINKAFEFKQPKTSSNGVIKLKGKLIPSMKDHKEMINVVHTIYITDTQIYRKITDLKMKSSLKQHSGDATYGFSLFIKLVELIITSEEFSNNPISKNEYYKIVDKFVKANNYQYKYIDNYANSSLK